MRARHSFLSTLLLAVLFFSHLPTAVAQILISTGSTDGIYYAVGQALHNIMSDNDVGEAKLLSSAGSAENLERLLNGEAHLGIIQSDVLFKAYRADASKMDRLRGIAALFPEYTQILVRKEGQRINSVAHLRGKKIYIGTPGSGTRTNATDILAAYAIEEGEYEASLVNLSSTEAVEALKQGLLDAVFMTSGELSVRTGADQVLRMIPLDEQVRIEIKEKHPYYGFTSIIDGTGKDTYVMFTRALLIAGLDEGATQINEGRIERLTIALTEQFESAVFQVTDRPIDVFRGYLLARGIPIPTHIEAWTHYQDVGYILEISSLWGGVLSLTVLLFSVLVANLSANWRWAATVRHRVRELSSKPEYGFWNRITRLAMHPLFITVTILSWLLLVDVLLILEFEESFALTTDARNRFADLNVIDLLTWLITFATTGFPQGLFPLSTPAKIAAAAIPLIGLGSVIFLLFYTSLKRNQRVVLEQSGHRVPALKDHVIICGWNERMPNLIRGITRTNTFVRGKKVVVIAEIDEERPLVKYRFRPNYVYYCRGASSDYKNLEKASINDAYRAVVAAGNRKVQQGNVRSIFTCVALRKFRPDLKSFSIIAELFYETNEDRFRGCEVTKLVPLEKVRHRLMVHGCLNPGMSNLITQILSFGSDQTPVLILVSEDPTLSKVVIEKTYRQAFNNLRKKDFLLLALYRPGSNSSQGETEIDFRLDSPYIINPPLPNNPADEMKIRETDFLIGLRYTSAGKSIELSGSLKSRPSCGRYDQKKEVLLVCGKKDDTDLIVKTLLSNGHKVIHLVYGDRVEVEVNNELSFSFCLETINQVSLSDLIENNVERFESITRAVVVGDSRLPSDGASSPFDDSVMEMSLILKYVYKDKFDRDLHIAAELRCDDNEALYQDSGIAQPIATNRMIEDVLTTMVFHGGLVSEFFLKSMSYSVENHLVRIERMAVAGLPDELQQKVVSFTYDGILLCLLEEGYQLIAIITDNGQIIINPGQGTELAGIEASKFDDIVVIRNLS